VTALLNRILLFFAVVTLSLFTLWLFFLALVGLTGLLAPLETQLWLAYSLFAFTTALGAWLLSRVTARWSLGVRALNENELWLAECLARLADKAGLRKPPELGVYESFEVNAFATGATRKRALIAISTGALASLPRPALEAILAHEIAHVVNGDMVTMTLLRGWINALVLIPARITARLVSQAATARQRGSIYFLTYLVFQLLVCPAASLLVCSVSRRREFAADAAGAKLVPKDQMRTGLMSLRDVYGEVDDCHQAFQALKISGHSARALAALFLTHPTIDARISRLT
jgi:heat shock protein HtpX